MRFGTVLVLFRLYGFTLPQITRGNNDRRSSDFWTEITQTLTWISKKENVALNITTSIIANQQAVEIILVDNIQGTLYVNDYSFLFMS